MQAFEPCDPSFSFALASTFMLDEQDYMTFDPANACRIKEELPDDLCDSECNTKALITKKRKPQQPPSACVICGDAAGYHHYDVASCNGCRTFFRRTLVLRRVYQCIGYGKCPQDMVRNCRACRFDRCILMGMNAVAVKLPPNADIEGILRAMDNRREELIAGSVKPFRFACVANAVADCRELESLLYIEARCMQLREPCDPLPLYSMGLRENIEATVQLGKIERFGVPSDPCSASISESEPIDVKPMQRSRFWLGTDLLLLVEMAKTLPLFETLSTDDKMFILKEVSLAGFMLERIFSSVNRQLPSIQMADETRRTSLMTKTGLESEVYVRPLEPFGRVQLTMEEFVLVKSLVYTSAGSNEMSPHAKELLTSERERYAQILLRHLQRSHGSLDGARRYAEVISLVDACFHFAQKFREHCIMLSLINTKVTPIFALSTEIFRWK